MLNSTDSEENDDTIRATTREYGLTQKGMYRHERRVKAWNFGFMMKRYCSIRAAKTTAMVSCAYTAKLIWASGVNYYIAFSTGI